MQRARGEMGSSSSLSYDPFDPLGEGDAGFGMKLVVDKPKRTGPKTVPVTVKYAAANMYASLIEKGCRRSAEGGAPADAWLLYVNVDGTFTAFHFASGTWHKVKYSVAGQQVIRKAWTGGGARILIELVPRLGVLDSTRKLWNPVTGSLLTLPPFRAISSAPAAVGISQDKIIAAGTDGSKLYTWVEVYTAEAQSWRALGSLPRPYALRMQDIVECKGNFYALIVYPDHHMLEIRQQGPHLLYVCATPKVWQPYLVNCEGTLYFVGVNHQDDIVPIWKLCESRWEEVARPLSPCANIERQLSSVIGLGRSLVFCLRNHEMLSFDLAKSTWSQLPSCPDPSFHALKWTPTPHDSTF